MNTLKKLVILDRDGVINADSAEFIKTPDEWIALPGSLEAIARLNQGGYRVVVASNQSGIGRGLFDMSALNAMHTKMHRAAAAVGGRIDAVFFCPHTARDQCDCRKRGRELNAWQRSIHSRRRGSAAQRPQPDATGLAPARCCAFDVRPSASWRHRPR